MRPGYRLILLLFISLTSQADEDGSQYSRLDQINTGNASQVELAFSHRNGDLGRGFPGKGHSFQATPVYWQGALYFSSSANLVIAIDAGSGTERWRFDPQLPRDIGYSESASRGVALWHGDVETCPNRVFHGTLTGHLYALDAASGKPCSDFGDNGRVDLGIDIRNRRTGDYSVTSPVAVLADRIIVGSAIGDNGAVELEQGIVRALDPVTGELLWQWDPIPSSPEDPASSTWQGQSASLTGAANAWAPISVDPVRRLVFIPTSSPSPDFYGGERLGDNHYANSLVALDADSGEVTWFRQLVHHDVWDYDVPAEPTLTTIRREGQNLPAVVVVTKTGMVFAFHRETGEPIYTINEQRVPASTVPGETTSPTQPMSSVALASQAPVTVDDAFGLLYFDKAGCEDIIRQSRSEGIFTPPSFEGTIESPGWAGGMNWGGIATDADTQLAITNFTNMPGLIQLLPRTAWETAVRNQSMPGWQLTAMAGTPYGMARRIFLSDLGLPCTQPPWGEIAAIDLSSGRTVWRRPFGTVRDLSPVPIPGFLADTLFADWGVPNLGGPLMTAGGITFIGATLDYHARIIDSQTGDELWRYRLPTSANSTPMTYLHEGRQHLALAVGGHSGAGTPAGDYLMVFALP